MNPLFTIPNFPSRFLSYMKNYLSFICFMDLVPDIGKIAVNNNFGYKCFSTDNETFFDHVIRRISTKDLREQTGQ